MGEFDETGTSSETGGSAIAATTVQHVPYGKSSSAARPGCIAPDEASLDLILRNLEVELYPIQKTILLDHHRTIQVAGGERVGKSWISGLFGATRTPFGSKFWIVAATYELARPEFTYWTEHLLKLGAIRDKRDISIPKTGKCVAICKSGQTIETKTADDLQRIAAVAPDGIIMAEAAQMPYEAYLKCVGRVAEKRGWLLLSGTFEGSLGWYPEKFIDWGSGNNIEGAISYSLPSWLNYFIYPGGRDDPEIKRMEAIYSRVEGMFEERCGAIPVPPSTLVFREYRSTIHQNPNIHYDPRLPVFLAVDPSSGGDPYAVLACQFPPYPYPRNENGHLTEEVPDAIDFCDVIDESYTTGENTEEIIAYLKRQAWWKNVRGGAIDVEATDERRRWAKYGNVPLVAKKIDQFAGIRRLKSFLHYKRDKVTGLVLEGGWPHLRLASHIRYLPYEFGKYKRKPNPEDTLLVVEKPPMNQPDHAIKAMWYLLVARYGDVKGAAKRGVVYTWQPPLYPS